MTDTYTPVLTDERILYHGPGQEDATWTYADQLYFGRAIERAAIEAYQRQQWRSIETAPTDGRTILLGYFNSHGKWRTLRGQWMSEAYIAEYWEDPDDVEPGWFETSVEADDPPNCWRIIEPTHWQPLPPPPEAQ